jgi:hypothetical protein
VTEPSDWQKGGIRYAKLKEVVPGYLAPEEVEGFFVAVRGVGKRRLFNPFTPFEREFVIAATPDGVRVLKLKLPGVFRASVRSMVFQGGGEAVSWDGERLHIAGTPYRPISFHAEGAEEVARLLAPSG